MIFTIAFADTAAQATATAQQAAGAAPQPSTLGMLLPFALMFAVFYFLMIRPQQKKMKAHESMVSELQKGEEVITQSGIFGKIHGIADKFITLEVDQNVKIKVLKNQIATVLRGDQKA
ncbi:MAG: preprotein translocase subunit YajC [Oligoflexia bacterium]|nr:preprotein translocase subunit YajC [Oligoflexia bacterium]